VQYGNYASGVVNGGWQSLGNTYQNTKLIVIYYEATLTNMVKKIEVIGGSGDERV
jgi:hypothetical protein